MNLQNELRDLRRTVTKAVEQLVAVRERTKHIEASLTTPVPATVTTRFDDDLGAPMNETHQALLDAAREDGRVLDERLVGQIETVARNVGTQVGGEDSVSFAGVSTRREAEQRIRESKAKQRR